MAGPTPLLRALAVNAVIAAALAALAGCGSSSTTTVTSTAANGPTSTATSTSVTQSTSVGASGHEPSLAAAAATVRSHGYLPATGGGYDPGASVAALIGVKKGSADGTAQRAFFFAGGRFIGTDTSDDSAGIRVAFSRPPVIALSYELFNPKDAQCCPTGGSTTVRYQWDGQRLVPLDPIPPISYSARGSRR